MWLMLIPAPYRILSLVLLGGACIGVGYVQGVSRESDRRDALELKTVRVAIKAANRESDRREAVAVKREVSREKIRTVYVKIKEEAKTNVEKNADIYAGCGLDADGLRLWNAANAGRTTALRGEYGSALPGASASTVGETGGLATKPRGRDGAGAPVPRSVGEVGGM